MTTWDRKRALELADYLANGGVAWLPQVADMLRASVTEVDEITETCNGYTSQIFDLDKKCRHLATENEKWELKHDLRCLEILKLRTDLEILTLYVSDELRLARAVVEAARSDADTATRWGTTDHRDTLAAVAAYDDHVAANRGT